MGGARHGRGPTLREGLLGDLRMFRRTYHDGRSRLVAALAFAAQPSTPMLLWMRLGTSERRALSLFARRRLIRGFGCDVERGARIAPGLLIGHPLGIVVGGGVVIEAGVKLHQHVTLGIGRGGCPTIAAGAYLLPGAVVVGAITVGREAVVGANAFVAADVAPGTTVPGGTRWTRSSASEPA